MVAQSCEEGGEGVGWTPSEDQWIDFGRANTICLSPLNSTTLSMFKCFENPNFTCLKI